MKEFFAYLRRTDAARIDDDYCIELKAKTKAAAEKAAPGVAAERWPGATFELVRVEPAAA